MQWKTQNQMVEDSTQLDLKQRFRKKMVQIMTKQGTSTMVGKEARRITRKACLQISSEKETWEHIRLQRQWWETRKKVMPVSLLAKFTASLTIKKKRRKQEEKHVEGSVPSRQALPKLSHP